MRAGESYRLFGSRGTARYVGLQTMNGIASTANELVDELEIDADGNFEVVLSAAGARRELDADRGRPPHADGSALLFYDWDTEKPSSLQIERLGDPVEAREHARSIRYVAVSRQLVALGEFVHDNLQFFLQFGAAATAQRLPASGRPHRDRGGRGEQTRSSAAGNWVPTRR